MSNVLLLALLMPAQNGYTWHQFPDAPHQWSLRWNGDQCGVWMADEGLYYPRKPVGSGFLAAAPCPVTPPTFNGGIDVRQLVAQPRYMIGGKLADRDQVEQLLTAAGAPQLPDDTGRPHVTLIGPQAERERAEAAIRSALKPGELEAGARFQSYPPDHWAVARAGFVTDGKPTLYIQAPGGQVLHRQDDDQGAAEVVKETLRDPSPSYRRDRDPDRRRTALPLLLWCRRVPTAVLVLGGVLLLVWLLDRGNGR